MTYVTYAGPAKKIFAYTFVNRNEVAVPLQYDNKGRKFAALKEKSCNP